MQLLAVLVAMLRSKSNSFLFLLKCLLSSSASNRSSRRAVLEFNKTYNDLTHAAIYLIKIIET